MGVNMEKDKILNIAKKTITEELQKENYIVSKIILFGSHIRGEEKKDSDWDFYVIVDKEIDIAQKRKIILNIKRKMLEYNILCDIIIQSQDAVDKMKNFTGYITYYAIKEGIRI